MKFLSVLIILMASFGADAQTIVSGTVKTSKGKAVRGANISISNSYDGGSSDSLGFFRFPTNEQGKVVLQFSSVGFNTDSLIVELVDGALSLNLVLREEISELNAVVITAGTFEAGDAKKGLVLNSLDVATTAGAEADVFAALQTLPGTQTAFSENGLFVRGGSAAETKTYFDGLLVKNPFNTQLPDLASRGRFSPFLFKGTTFSSGGYSAQYGQALSSALILESKDLPEKTTTGISLMTVGGGLDHAQRFKNSSLSLGGSYINLKPAFSLFKQRTNWDKEPEQYGGIIQYKLKTSETGIIKIYSEYGRSTVSLFTENLDSLNKQDYFSNRNKNFYVNSTYQDFVGNKWKVQSGISYSNTSDDGLFDTDEYERADRLLQGRVTVTNFTGSLSSVKFGAEAAAFTREESLNSLKRHYTDESVAAFAEGDVYFTTRLVARFGLRLERSSYLGMFNLAPRTSLAYKTGRYSQISLAYGRFFQNPEDGYLIQSKDLGFEQAEHYILNYQFIGEGQVFRVEGFYKDYRNLVKAAGSTFNNSGDGYAGGFDLFWRDKKTFKGLDYWISYSYLDTKRNFRDYPALSVPPFAAKHTLNIVYKQYVAKIRSQVGATYTYSTGRTYFNPGSSEFLGDRTKSFQNFSINLSYLTNVFRQFTVVYLSVNNVPGFKNVYGYHFSDNGSIRRPIGSTARRNFFVGMFVTIGDDKFVR
ncbi:TonB-dependent receptor [Flavihumibacter sp. R14]|nr:TonB-dependent receptor [Flavihumibacter soli]